MKIIAAILATAVAGIIAIAVAENDDPHAFTDADCGICHDMSATGKVLSTKRASATCTPCHNNLTEGAYMHPIDSRPNTVGIASGFPLSEKGNITCSTCHDVHSSPRTPFSTKSYFLRSFERGKAFCDLCHSLKPSSKSSHQAVLTQAHFQAKESETDSFLGIDPISKSCLTCHDGSLGSAVALNSGLWGHQGSLLPHDGGSHPIGMDYEMTRMKHGPKTDLRPLFDVDPRIKLFDGKVGCGSCHDPFSRLSKNLVMSDWRSSLCLSCHALDGRKK